MPLFYEFKCTIQAASDSDVQWSHLPEELEAYLNAHYGEEEPPTVMRWTVQEVAPPSPKCA